MVDPLKIFWVLANSTYLVTRLMQGEVSEAGRQQDPYFRLPLLEADVDEDAPPTHLVTAVAPPPDRQQPRDPGVRYGIAAGNVGAVFSVDPETGDVRVAKALDFETRSRYELLLVAVSEEGRAVGQATLLVRVKDANDLPPVFEQPVYRATVTEEDDHHLPRKILTVKAVDGDTERPHDVVYFITGPGVDPDNPAAGNFRIDPKTGDIFILKALDRDPPDGRPHWRFTAFAQDEAGQGQVGYTDIHVAVSDVNDNAPVFPQPVYWGSVVENSSAGEIVANMTAVDYDDPDEGTNAKILYTIEKNVVDEDTGRPIFEVDPETGVIRTAICCLDRERTADYAIQVVAVDGGGLKAGNWRMPLLQHLP